MLSHSNGRYTLTFSFGKANAITDEVINQINEALDTIEQDKAPTALVLTSDNPKFWCAGLDLNWLKDKADDFLPQFGPQLDALLKRLALLNCPTIACINGHAFGMGALMACAADFRIMAQGEAKFCFPEVDVKIPFTPTMYDLIRLTLAPHVQRELVFTGKPIQAEEALAKHVVDLVVAPDTALQTAMGYAAKLAEKDRKTYTLLKQEMRKQLAD